MQSRNLHKELRAFYRQRAQDFQRQYKRLVPLGDMVSDRWEKAALLGFGQDSSIYDSAVVIGTVTVGENVWIGPNVLLDGAEAPLTIGSWCSISAGVQIYTHHTVAWAITGGKQSYEYAPTTIGSNVYIGPLSVIPKGINIGNHVIVGSQSFVNMSLPDYAVAWGQPAKIVGTVMLSEDGNSYSIKYF